MIVKIKEKESDFCGQFRTEFVAPLVTQISWIHIKEKTTIDFSITNHL